MARARKKYEKLFTPQVVLPLLVDFYERVVDRHAAANGANGGSNNRQRQRSKRISGKLPGRDSLSRTSPSWSPSALTAAESRLGRDQLWVNPDCGLKTRQWHEVLPALEHLVQAAHKRRAAKLANP